MKLKTICVKNFKAVTNCEIELTNVTLLVGANNSGKSSILQAIHFASTLMRSASEANKNSTLSLSAAEYIPTENYKQLSHGNSEWGNATGTPESEVEFIFQAPEPALPMVPADNPTASIKIKAARNEGLSLYPQIPQPLFEKFRNKEHVFTAYIPGLAGIPLKEEFITERHVLRKVASGDSNVVLRNILLMLKKSGKEMELLQSIREIYPNVSLISDFDEANDFYINSEITIGGGGATKKPLEFSGTGFLQVVQIFAYLILFRPAILLIDEPESHLHPTLQVKLIRTLEKKAKELDAYAIITTHSPFIARGLPFGSRTVWVANGQVQASSTGNEIKKALGWGAIDRKVIICTEDGTTSTVDRILMQDEDLYDRVSVVPFEGIEKIGSGAQIKSLKVALGNTHTVIVHRDRDCMSDDELKTWNKNIIDNGLIPWVTIGSDIESYFCSKEHVASALEISQQQAQSYIQAAFDENSEFLMTEFQNKRKEVNKKIYEKTGGSPGIADLWDKWAIAQKTKGKTFVSKLRIVAADNGHDEKRIGRPVNDGSIVAQDLLDLIKSSAD